MHTRKPQSKRSRHTLSRTSRYPRSAVEMVLRGGRAQRQPVPPCRSWCSSAGRDPRAQRDALPGPEVVPASAGAGAAQAGLSARAHRYCSPISPALRTYSHYTGLSKNFQDREWTSTPRWGRQFMRDTEQNWPYLQTPIDGL